MTSRIALETVRAGDKEPRPWHGRRMTSPEPVDDAPVTEHFSDPYGLRPTWRGWLHFAAFLVVMPAGIFLLAGVTLLAADGVKANDQLWVRY